VRRADHEDRLGHVAGVDDEDMARRHLSVSFRVSPVPYSLPRPNKLRPCEYYDV
jgi:hypothetical protein